MNSICRVNGNSTPFQRMIDDFFTEPFAFVAPMSSLSKNEGNLALDVSEDESGYIVRASVPGFKKEEVDVSAHNGVLTVRAEHSEEREEKAERYHRRERRVDSFFRSVGLPGEFEEDKTRAELKDGVLTVRLAKTPRSMPRKISVS